MILLIWCSLCLAPHRNADTHSILFYPLVCLFVTLRSVTQCFLTICLYYLILLLPVIQLKPALLFAPVTLLILPLLLSLHLFLVRTVLYHSLYVVIQRRLAHGCMHSTCQTVMDTVAPLKIRQPKTKFEPWLNDTVRAVRRDCRRAERKWKKDKLHVSLQIRRDCWHHFQKTVKEAKINYISEIILSNCNKPCVLFKTIDAVLHAPQTVYVDASSAFCENFLHFFINKVISTRALISPPSNDPSVSVLCSAVFDKFELVTLSVLHYCHGVRKGHRRKQGSGSKCR